MSKDLNIKDAITELACHGDSILTVAFADKIARAFGYDDAKDAGAHVYEADEGIDWNDRAERWKAGEQVNCYDLAASLADSTGAPDVPGYRTDYIGMGKRTRALTGKAVLRLRLKFEEGVVVPRCSSCEDVEPVRYDPEGHPVPRDADEGKCWPCHRDQDGEAA